MTAFWDASALLPICIPSQDGGESRRLLRDNPPVVWWGTYLEVMSAICRLRRERQLTPDQQEAAGRRLRLLQGSWREIQPTERVRQLARTQMEQYPLRASDALQLAAALVWCQERPRSRTFLCRDRRLADAGRLAGFKVVD